MSENTEQPTCPRFPFGAGRPIDLEPQYAQFRRDKPVAQVELAYGGNAWLVTRMAETKSLLGDTRFSRQAMMGDMPRPMPEPIDSGGAMTMMDPPEHQRTRRLIAKAFKKRRVEQMRPRLAEIAEELVDRMMAKGQPADLVADFGSVLPSYAICLLLGVPHEDWDELGKHVKTIMQQGSIPIEDVMAAWGVLSTYFVQMVAARRADPTDDLISGLATATDGDDSFSDQEVVLNVSVLFAAGYETTACQIVNSVCALMRYPDQMNWLRENLDALPNAVEELLRFVPLTPAGVMASVAMEDVEIAGVTIPKGDAVFPCPVSANRDETVFTRPDELDIQRGAELNQHIAFGIGPHYCVGAALARMELQVALESILRRMPGIQLTVPEADLPRKPGLVMRAFDTFPITW